MYRDFKETVDAFTTGQQINWLTIPPRTPHFGDPWEAAIKSMKRHFYRTVGTTKLFFENFITLITQVEPILNSLPLAAPSSDADDPSGLKPAYWTPTNSFAGAISRKQPDTKQKVQKHQQHCQKFCKKVVRGLLDNVSTSTKMAR